MRIIAGKYKGRRLASSRDLSIRPTTNKIKEYIFQLLDDFVVDARVLDLFSGSGGLGLEALSRGARHVSFVDRSAKSIQILRKNITSIGLEACCQTIKMETESFVKRNETPFDLIFADPPFPWTQFDKLIPMVFADHNLTADGIVVLEFEKTHPLDLNSPHFELLRSKKFDRSIIAFMGKRDTP